MIAHGSSSTITIASFESVALGLKFHLDHKQMYNLILATCDLK